MPAVDINAGSQPSIGNKQGFGTGLPTPVLLAVVGGGIGLVVFLTRKTGSNTGTGADKGTLLPNTAIMLGSLQQGILDLQGKVTMGNADLSSQITGVGESLGTQIDAQTAGYQQSFADLNTYLGSNFQVLQGSESSLAQAIAGLGTQNVGLADSLTAILNQIYGVDAGLTNLGTKIDTVGNQVQYNNQGVLSGINQILNGQNSQTGLLNGLGNSINAISPDWSQMNNVKFFSQDGTGWFVSSGKLFAVSSWNDWNNLGSNFRNIGTLSTDKAHLDNQSSGYLKNGQMIYA